MGSQQDHEFRSRELADSLRNYLLTVNASAIGLIFGIAGFLSAYKVSPNWAICPVIFFIIGLLSCAASIFLAQYRAIKRRDSAKDRRNDPKFAWYQTSIAWNGSSFIFFVLGIISSLHALQALSL